MRKLNCVVVDDEPLAIELMKSYITRTPFLDYINGCSSATELLGELKEHNVDLIFMDIHIPDINGLELSKLIDSNIMVIFVTAYERYALESYKVNAVDYLLKPISYAEFVKSANKALDYFLLRSSVYEGRGAIQSNQEESIFVKSDYKLMQINLNDIVYIEGLKDYIKIFLDNEVNPVVSLVSMKSIEESLSTDYFIRVHRSFIVNMNKVKLIDKSRIVFGKVFIPISDSYKERFNEYISEKLVMK